MASRPNKNKKFLLLLLSLILFGSHMLFLAKRPALALGTDVEVYDFSEERRDVAQDRKEDIFAQIKKVGAAAFKSALGYFLDNIAIDTATYIASGGEGQKPLFYTDGWGAYLERLGDNAAGTFIQNFAQGVGLGNICTPRFDFRLGLTLGLKQAVRPPEPLCSFSQLIKNWDSAVRDPQRFLSGINAYFNPNENDLAIGLSVYSNFYTAGQRDILTSTAERMNSSGGFKDVKDVISNKILTPGGAIYQQFGLVSSNATKKEEKFTGEIVADAVDTFTQTLASKLLQRVFQKGLALSFGRNSDEERFNWDNIEALVSSEASPQARSQADVRQEFANTLSASFSVGNPAANRMEVTAQLLGDGVIDSQFKSAIDRQLTVKQAIDQGLLHVSGAGSTFGFSSSDKQPDVHEGYSSNMMIILRKYRILPVGWELAAAYIKENFQDRIYSLGDIIRGSETPGSPFYHLIDTNWVLKAPETFCRFEGPGERLSLADWRTENIQDNTQDPPKEYEFNRQIVSRDNYCADAKSCIFEDEKGDCIYYGYCTEEKSLWRFNTESCPAYYNTCQNYSNNENDTFSLLASTLSSEDCSVNSVGCQWYCADYNKADNRWACVVSEERVIRPCDEIGGCNVVDPATGRSCIIQNGHISCTVSSCNARNNTIPNPGFESAGTNGNPAAGWVRLAGNDTDIQRVSGVAQQVNNGNFSLRIVPDGISSVFSAKVSPDLTIDRSTVAGNAAYVLSGWIYSNLIYGQATLSVIDANNVPLSEPDGCTTDPGIKKGEWANVRCTFTVQGSVITTFSVQASVGPEGTNIPSGRVWFDDVTVQPECPTQDVVVYMNSIENENESKLYFDRDVRECDAEGEGCHEFIRTQPGLGTNLIPNGSFETWQDADAAPEFWSIPSKNFAQGSEGAILGSHYLVADGGADIFTPTLNTIERGTTYILSFNGRKVGAASAFSAAFDYLDSATNSRIRTPNFTFPSGTNVALTNEWNRFVSRPYTVPSLPADAADIRLWLNEDIGGVKIHLDGVMLEEVNASIATASTYAEYGQKNISFLKQAPASMKCTGNPEVDHADCAKFAAQCSAAEVGCQLYTPDNGDPAVPGIVSAYDSCPRECVGYQAYIQTQTNFEDQKPFVSLITASGKRCSSVEVGCDEFTNLDTLAKGGEAREYFTYLRQCQKPDDSCAIFYTWVGSDTQGYQLKNYNLRDADHNQVPDTVPSPRTDLGNCATAQDAFDNPNCREFYSSENNNATPTYAIVQNTISCTDQCFAYRQTETTQNDCENHGGYFGVCAIPAGVSCSTIGFELIGSSECWTTQARCTTVAGPAAFTPRDMCIYQAVPAEGEKCTAAAASCREYRGTTSSNVRVVFNDNLESGTSKQWVYGALSSDALAVGGHSLKTVNIGGNQVIETFAAAGVNGVCNQANYPTLCTNPNDVNCFKATTQTCVFANGAAGQSCEARLGQDRCGVFNGLIQSKTGYTLTFWAKSSTGAVADMTYQWRTPGGVQAFANTAQVVEIGQDWQEYTIGPFEFNQNQIVPGMSFILSSLNVPVNYDFITLKAVQEYDYLIKNSWTTPISCDTNPYISPVTAGNAPQFMLGCQTYTNQDGKSLNLKSFDRLCRESAVGCEKMIDTHNSDSPFAQTFNEGSGLSQVDVPADSLAYIVNDPTKTCFADVRGCMAVGLPTLNGDESVVTSYETKYLINDPDEYATALCSDRALGCQEFVSEQEGLVYFRDPKNRTCDYRLIPGTSQFGWFKKGSVAAFPDCPTTLNKLGTEAPGKSCVGGSAAGAACVSDAQCSDGGRCIAWTGVCSNDFASCNAYLDPVSSINGSVLPNSNLEGYFKVCSTSGSPCVDSNQCQSGETCGPDTELYQWILSSEANHVRSGGVGNSSAVQFTNTDGQLHNATLSQGMVLEKGTLYTIIAKTKDVSSDATLVIQGFAGAFGPFDSSVIVSPSGSSITLSIGNSVGTAPTGEFKTWAGRFFVNSRRVDDARVIVTSDAGVIDDIEVKKAGVYYYLSQGIDKTSCNGVVSPEQGCVLFNDTSQDLLTFSSLDSKAGGPPAQCTSSSCDSNAVMKVVPDRDCGKWLECVSGREQVNYKTGKTENFCQQMALCDSLNPANGQCNNFPAVNQTEAEYDSGSVDLIKNMTGYSKVGFIWDGGGTAVAGYYPYSAMEQKRICVQPAEKFGETCIEDNDCTTNPLVENGRCQPILKVADDKNIFESCRIYPEGASPRWGNQGPVDDGETPAASILVNLNNPLAAETWQTVGIDSKNPKTLENASECVYYKEKSLFEGVYGFCVEKDPRSPYLCLNWLPVDEITGGWIGLSSWTDNLPSTAYYCAAGSVLEPRVKKSVTKKYSGNFFNPYFETDPTLGSDTTGTDSCGGLICPTGYKGSSSNRNCGGFLSPATCCTWTCTPDPADYKFTDEKGVVWYDYRDKFNKTKNATKKHLMYCDGCAGEGTVIYDPEQPADIKMPAGWLRVCDDIVKVTSDDGNDRGWKQRLEASREFASFGYKVPTLGLAVDTVNAPFGRIGARFTTGDPVGWSYITDFVEARNFDRPYFSDFEGGKNVGQIFHDTFSALDPVPHNTTLQGAIERIKRLFAQSFGSWHWNKTTYEPITKTDSRCVGGSNNGVSCTATGAECNDTTSVCAFPAGAGYCEYSNTVGTNKIVVGDRDIACNNSGQCASAVFCAQGFCHNSDPDTSSFKPCNNTTQCSGGETCDTTVGYGYCNDAEKKSCTENPDCAPGVTCTKGGIGRCSSGINSGASCGTNAKVTTCDVGTPVCVGQCSAGSAKAGQDCRAAIDCQVNGVCSDFSYWVPPTNICPSNIRPNYFTEQPFDPSDPTRANPADPLAPGDWCGVAPDVFNISVENSIGPSLTLNGGGNVTLNFNVKVDENQLPLKKIEIDWGDGTPRTINAPTLGIRDKSDLRDPFSFPHRYQYNSGLAGGGDNNYQIHILVKDNWGWCSCIVKDAASCKPDIDAAGNSSQCPGEGASNLSNSNVWIPVTTVIIVKP